MTTATTLDPRRGTATKIIVTVAILAFAGALFLIASLALFTDQASTTDNLFTTGTIDIAASPATAAVTMPAMAPGDEVTAPMLLANNGTLELRYSAISTTTEDVLAAELVLSIREGVAPADCNDTDWDSSGTEIYSGVLGTMAGTALFGSNAAGGQLGDRVLAAGASEDLCLNVILPLSATGVEGLSTTATFVFDAEQTANNP